MTHENPHIYDEVFLETAQIMRLTHDEFLELCLRRLHFNSPEEVAREVQRLAEQWRAEVA